MVDDAKNKEKLKVPLHLTRQYPQVYPGNAVNFEMAMYDTFSNRSGIPRFVVRIRMSINLPMIENGQLVDQTILPVFEGSHTYKKLARAQEFFSRYCSFDTLVYIDNSIVMRLKTEACRFEQCYKAVCTRYASEFGLSEDWLSDFGQHVSIRVATEYVPF